MLSGVYRYKIGLCFCVLCHGRVSTTQDRVVSNTKKEQQRATFRPDNSNFGGCIKGDTNIEVLRGTNQRSKSVPSQRSKIFILQATHSDRCAKRPWHDARGRDRFLQSAWVVGRLGTERVEAGGKVSEWESKEGGVPLVLAHNAWRRPDQSRNRQQQQQKTAVRWCKYTMIKMYRKWQKEETENKFPTGFKTKQTHEISTWKGRRTVSILGGCCCRLLLPIDAVLAVW